MEKACLPSNWGKNVVASGIIYSLFDDYDQPKLSLALSNMTVTQLRILRLAGMPKARLTACPFTHQIVNATPLGLAAAKVCFGSQRNYGTKNLKIVPLLYYFFIFLVM